MAIYQYRGMHRNGSEVKARVNAESVVQAKQRIKAMGIMLLDIKEQKARSTGSSLLSVNKGVNVNELALMTRQLATLISAKIQIVEALRALTDQVENKNLQVVLAEVRQKVNEGSSLAKAFREYPHIFNDVYANMVEAGESSGTLDIVLNRLSEFTETQVKLKNKIKGALTYPVIMAVAGSIIVSVIFIFVVPQLAQIFDSVKVQLPIQTRITLAISRFMQSYWWVVLITVVFGAITFKNYISGRGKERWHGFLLKAPLVGDLIKKVNISRFSSSLGTLLNSGVPIITAMNIVRNLISNIHMREVMTRARESVAEGNKLATPLEESGMFPPMVTHMISLGEQSGELENMLNIVAENYEDQVKTKLEGLTSMLEPLMMIFMGLFVAFIVFSIVVPMMEINSLGSR